MAEHRFLGELREFLQFLSSLWGILAGISLLFPLSNLQPSSIFRYAFDLAGNPTHPKLCFLTTGTGDRKTSIDSFYVGASEERPDFCVVQVTGDCLITFYGHNSVDANRAVGDLPGTGHLGWQGVVGDYVLRYSHTQ